MSQRIRIESHEGVVMNAKIEYLPDEDEVTDDGEWVGPVDISNCVQGVDIHLHVGEVSRATLHAILVEGSYTAEVEDVIVRRLGPQRHFRRTRRWWHRLTGAAKLRIVRSLEREAQREITRGRWPGK